ncbi:MAG: phosphotransferase family protein, partial [Acidimicrobiia bacterium]|nr:phosphotransferase family protein [Acidimicrobiia bacterium]
MSASPASGSSRVAARSAERRAAELADGLAAFLRFELGDGAEPVVRAVEPVSSIGNARDPWAFEVAWRSGDGVERTQRCVMLLKADAGQLETRLGPEFHAIAALHGSGVPVAPALWLDETGRWLGQPFFVTGFVDGTASMRPLRVEGGVEEIRSVALALARAAGRLHRFDWGAAGLAEHLPVVPADRVALAELERWEELFVRHRLEPHPGLVYLFEWLRQRAPVAERISVVHGDLRFGNVLYAGDRLMALLDWEMVHLGDPLEDLGWVYRKIWTPVRSLGFDEFLTAYEAEAGWAVDR